MENNVSTYQLDYTSYDRQLNGFIILMEVFLHGWTDYRATELSSDIHSLCHKAARLCFMADQDYILQQEELVPRRSTSNRQYCERMERLLHDDFIPMIREVIRQMREHVGLRGSQTPYYKGGVVEVLPQLHELLAEDGMKQGDFDRMQGVLKELTKAMDKLKGKVNTKPQTGERPEQRLWYLMHLYMLVCFLVQHFQRLTKHMTIELAPGELRRIFIRTIRQYADSTDGAQLLMTYRTRLEYCNDSAPLTQDQIENNMRELVHELPERVQLCYMQHADDYGVMANELKRLQPTDEELEAFVIVMAKRETLKMMLNEESMEEKQGARLYNEVFYTHVAGRPINFIDLRERLKRMAMFVDKKNQWFCLWCVLRHHNLLANENFEAFARQMQHPDWLQSVGAPSFTGDNLGDYRDYFSTTDYKRWNLESFNHYRILHGKKKWSETMFHNFSNLCKRMEEVY